MPHEYDYTIIASTVSKFSRSQTCQPSQFWRDSPAFFYQMSHPAKSRRYPPILYKRRNKSALNVCAKSSLSIPQKLHRRISLASWRGCMDPPTNSQGWPVCRGSFYLPSNQPNVVTPTSTLTTSRPLSTIDQQPHRPLCIVSLYASCYVAIIETLTFLNHYNDY